MAGRAKRKKARMRRAARLEQQATVPNGTGVGITDRIGTRDAANVPVGTQDVPGTVPDTKHGQPGGDSQSTPQIRKPTTALGKLKKAVDDLGDEAIEGIVKSLVADATSAEDPKARTAAANAFARIAKLCAEEDDPKGPETQIHGDVNINVDGGGNRVLAAAARLGLGVSLAGDGPSSNVIDGTAELPAATEAGRPESKE